MPSIEASWRTKMSLEWTNDDLCSFLKTLKGVSDDDRAMCSMLDWTGKTFLEELMIADGDDDAEISPATFRLIKGNLEIHNKTVKQWNESDCGTFISSRKYFVPLERDKMIDEMRETGFIIDDLIEFDAGDYRDYFGLRDWKKFDSFKGDLAAFGHRKAPVREEPKPVIIVQPEPTPSPEPVIHREPPKSDPGPQRKVQAKSQKNRPRLSSWDEAGVDISTDDESSSTDDEGSPTAHTIPAGSTVVVMPVSDDEESEDEGPNENPYEGPHPDSPTPGEIKQDRKKKPPKVDSFKRIREGEFTVADLSEAEWKEIYEMKRNASGLAINAEHPYGYRAGEGEGERNPPPRAYHDGPVPPPSDPHSPFKQNQRRKPTAGGPESDLLNQVIDQNAKDRADLEASMAREREQRAREREEAALERERAAREQEELKERIRRMEEAMIRGNGSGNRSYLSVSSPRDDSRVRPDPYEDEKREDVPDLIEQDDSKRNELPLDRESSPSAYPPESRRRSSAASPSQKPSSLLASQLSRAGIDLEAVAQVGLSMIVDYQEKRFQELSSPSAKRKASRHEMSHEDRMAKKYDRYLKRHPDSTRTKEELDVQKAFYSVILQNDPDKTAVTIIQLTDMMQALLATFDMEYLVDLSHKPTALAFADKHVTDGEKLLRVLGFQKKGVLDIYGFDISKRGDFRSRFRIITDMINHFFPGLID